MKTVTSHDGTPIAYDKTGSGPPLILIDGALTSRASGSKPELLGLLAPHFTVFSFDRRGRGDSGDTPPYAVEREVEDVEALLALAGGSAALYGHSSGACLVLEAAMRLGAGVTRAVLYEAPYNDDPAAQPAFRAYLQELSETLAAGRRGDAVALFMRYAGTPPERIAGMRRAPYWLALEALAPTLAYDGALVGPLPRDRLANIGAPVLAICGGASYPFMRTTAQALSELIPCARFLELPDQTHLVQPAGLAPVLIEFLTP